jgi:hypothetical protein
VTNYIKKKVVNEEKVVDGKLCCLECGNEHNSVKGFDVVNIINKSGLDEIHIEAVCNSCSMMNVFIYKHIMRKSRSTFKLVEVWLEIADDEDK